MTTSLARVSVGFTGISAPEGSGREDGCAATCTLADWCHPGGGSDPRPETPSSSQSGQHSPLIGPLDAATVGGKRVAIPLATGAAGRVGILETLPPVCGRHGEPGCTHGPLSRRRVLPPGWNRLRVSCRREGGRRSARREVGFLMIRC